MIITAPYDGLVGNIHGRVGEHQSSFSTLVTFYEQHPTLVKGYVHESLLLQVKLNDSLDVVSMVRPELFCRGQVVALGTRVVEIPERLRKMPEIKAYGREILVAIPTKNDFLQKEKVQLFIEASH
jgi:multidrug resistance efflux pump